MPLGKDPTPMMLARAAAKHDPPEPVLGEVECLPFRSGDADVVTCRFGLHHFADPGAALREMVRVCRTGGIVGVVELAAPDLTALAHIYNRYERLRGPSHVLARSVGGLRRLLRDAGLDVNYVETRNVPVNLGRWLDLTSPPDPVRERTASDLDAELGGAEPTGLRPQRRADGLWFHQNWAVIRATR